MISRSSVRRLGTPFALVLAGFAFSFLVLEIGLRISGFDRQERISKGRELILRESGHPVRRYELTPNAEGHAWQTDVRINSHGMRDREYPLERTGAPRIAVIGDSITFGSGISPDERFSEQLEALLSRKLARPVEVLNFGVGGYDALQGVATLEDIGLPFAPDLVIVGYCVNDLADNSPNLEYIRNLQSSDSPLYQLRSVQFLSYALDRLQLIRRLRIDNQDDRFAERFRDQLAPVAHDRELAKLRSELQARMQEREPDFRLPWYLSDAHLGKVEFAFARLRRLADEHGFGAMIAIIPILEETPAYDVVYRMVQHMALRNRLEPVILKPYLEPEGFERLRLKQRDPIHPNARGNRLIAEALAPLVAARFDSPVKSGVEGTSP